MVLGLYELFASNCVCVSMSVRDRERLRAKERVCCEGLHVAAVGMFSVLIPCVTLIPTELIG